MIFGKIIPKIFFAKQQRVLNIKQGIINMGCGPGSSVGIATDYGLEGPGSNPVGTRFSARPGRPWGTSTLL